MRAGTIYIFFGLFYYSYHAPSLEVEDRCCCADDCEAWTDHACLSTLCLCAFPCASNFHSCPPVCVSAQRANMISQHADRSSGGGNPPTEYHCLQR